jgi:hypothetical protein
MEIQEIKIIVKNYESKTLTFLTKEKQNKNSQSAKEKRTHTSQNSTKIMQTHQRKVGNRRHIARTKQTHDRKLKNKETHFT